MSDLLNKLMANDFANLRGLSISGTVPVKQEVINELITEFLQQGSAAPSDVATTPTNAAPNLSDVSSVSSSAAETTVPEVGAPTIVPTSLAAPGASPSAEASGGTDATLPSVGAATSAAVAETPSRAAASPSLPGPSLPGMQTLLKFVKKAEIKADGGRITLDFEIRV